MKNLFYVALAAAFLSTACGETARSRGSLWRGVLANLLDDLLYLVHGAAVGHGPRTPLLAIDGPQISIFVGPCVPNADPILLEVSDVGRPLEEPEKFVGHAPKVFESKQMEEFAVRSFNMSMNGKVSLFTQELPKAV